MVNLNVQGKIQNFSVSIKKELDNDKTITYRLKFIDHSFRFMQSKLSELFDNLSEVYKKEFKGSIETKKYQIRMQFYWA